MECRKFMKRWPIQFRRDRLLTRYPGEQVLILYLQQSFVIVQFSLAQVRQTCVGEPSHDQIRLPDAAMPGAESQFSSSYVQWARTFGFDHEFLDAGALAYSPDRRLLSAEYNKLVIPAGAKRRAGTPEHKLFLLASVFLGPGSRAFHALGRDDSVDVIML